MSNIIFSIFLGYEKISQKTKVDNFGDYKNFLHLESKMKLLLCNHGLYKKDVCNDLILIFS